MIKTSEDANKYYQLVNQYIDEYVETWNIKPTNLKSYLLGNKSNLLKFIERRGLSEVSNIETVLSDVIDDRVSLFNDSIMTFENFKFLESNEFQILDLRTSLFKGVQKASIEHEKILADLFDVSLSQIDVINSDEHTFSIDNDKIYVFSNSEKLILEENILIHIYNKLKDQKLVINIGNQLIEISSDVYLKTFEDFKTKMTIKDELSNYIAACLSGEFKEDNAGNLIITIM